MQIETSKISAAMILSVLLACRLWAPTVRHHSLLFYFIFLCLRACIDARFLALPKNATRAVETHSTATKKKKTNEKKYEKVEGTQINVECRSEKRLMCMRKSAREMFSHGWHCHWLTQRGKTSSNLPSGQQFSSVRFDLFPFYLFLLAVGNQTSLLDVDDDHFVTPTTSFFRFAWDELTATENGTIKMLACTRGEKSSH